ncbi:MAG: formylglycine-generating enzyme family protein, partial [Treponema sp.]|nr:formylglycine-generating enzyme family protein [Treponema sp.]
NATWNAAICSPTADGYRLPTEAEWEWAARGGPANESYTYAGSNTVGNVAWYNGSGSSGTHEVKGLAPNGANLYDMSGNVLELCWDRDGSSNRALRGGNWNDSNTRCAISYPGYNTPYLRNYLIGFRVVRTAP